MGIFSIWEFGLTGLDDSDRRTCDSRDTERDSREWSCGTHCLRLQGRGQRHFSRQPCGTCFATPLPSFSNSSFPELFRVGWELFDNDTDMMLHWQLGKKLASGGVQESTTHFRILSGPRNYIRKLVEAAAAAAGKFSMWAFPFLLISFRVPSLIFPGRFFSVDLLFGFGPYFWEASASGALN